MHPSTRAAWLPACLLAAGAAAVLAGCGARLSGVRRSQDWSAADDPRLALACHVGEYGSGVLLACDAAGARVLTCAHLVDADETVDVRFHDPASGAWREYEGRVVRRTHPHRQDLAEIRIRSTEFHLAPQVTPLAPAEAETTEFTASLVNVAFGAEDRPFVLDLPAFGHVASISSVEQDADGTTSWRVPKVLVHGGVTAANSGSPVFADGALVGLVESAPAFAKGPDGATRGGVLVSGPATIREFLGASERPAAGGAK